MTLKKMKKSHEILQAMLIHENGIVSHRGFTSYDEIVAYRERNKNDKVILEVGTES
ncbi:hypothetical protein Ilyop_1287 [Ilyobacter polytropus DSM 2926]|jgi:hypothetical protein|uniref:Uncharacterized protein n=2 Tax=Ilyobacter TaxID=167639 RepID=E3H9F9_ILYPC|nr:hypothetical protein Ilyop_1287 [Ilyobacter polytropus DSM 2926]